MGERLLGPCRANATGHRRSKVARSRITARWRDRTTADTPDHIPSRCKPAEALGRAMQAETCTCNGRRRTSAAAEAEPAQAGPAPSPRLCLRSWSLVVVAFVAARSADEHTVDVEVVQFGCAKQPGPGAG